MNRLDARQLRVSAIQTSVVAVVAAAVGWLLGLDAWKAMLIMVAVALGGTLRQLDGFGDNFGWPDKAEVSRDRGTRREVARLSWALQGHEAHVDARSGRRLRELAFAILAEGHPADARASRPMVIDHHSVAARLGPRAARTLTLDRPHYSELVHVLDRLEALAGTVPRKGDPRS